MIETACDEAKQIMSEDGRNMKVYNYRLSQTTVILYNGQET